MYIICIYKNTYTHIYIFSFSWLAYFSIVIKNLNNTWGFYVSWNNKNNFTLVNSISQLDHSNFHNGRQYLSANGMQINKIEIQTLYMHERTHYLYACERYVSVCECMRSYTAFGLTSRRRCPSIAQAIIENRPWRVKSNIVRCPNHTWYRVACSKGISISRRRTDPLEIGRNRNAKQINPMNPKRSPISFSINKLKSSSYNGKIVKWNNFS